MDIKIPFIIMTILCFIMGGLYVVFSNKPGWQGLILRGGTILSILANAFIMSNLREINNALPIFFVLALAVLMLSEATYASDKIEEKAKIVIFSVFNIVANLLFAVSAVTLAEFNYFAILGGVFFGIGMGLVISAIKRSKENYKIICSIAIYVSLGLLIGFSLMGIIGTRHLISSVMMLGGGVLLTVSNVMRGVLKEGKIIDYVIKGINIAGLIIMTMMIYFY